MDFTLHQLEIFLTVVEFKSITKASEKLYMTQPAVSIQLKNFQTNFKMPLVEYVGKQLYVTEYGEEIAISARKILEQVYNIHYRSTAYEKLLFGRIKFSIVSTAKYILPYYLTKFVKSFPDIHIQIDVTNRWSVIEAISNNNTDFALVSIMPESLDLKEIPLFTNELYMVAPAGDYTFKTIDDVLNELTLIHREEGSGTKLMMDKYLKSHNIRTHQSMQLTSNEAVKQAILAGWGCSILPIIGIREQIINNQMTILHQDDLPIKTQWRIVWLKKKITTPAMKAFIRYLLDHKDEVTKRYFNIDFICVIISSVLTYYLY